MNFLIVRASLACCGVHCRIGIGMTLAQTFRLIEQHKCCSSRLGVKDDAQKMQIVGVWDGQGWPAETHWSAPPYIRLQIRLPRLHAAHSSDLQTHVVHFALVCLNFTFSLVKFALELKFLHELLYLIFQKTLVKINNFLILMRI